MIHNHLLSPSPVGSRHYEAPLTERFDLSLEAVICQSDPAKYNNSNSETLTEDSPFGW